MPFDCHHGLGQATQVSLPFDSKHGLGKYQEASLFLD